MKFEFRQLTALVLAGTFFSSQAAFAAPEEILTHKPMMVWDYLIPSYDESGQVIIKSKESTFRTKPSDPFAKVEGRPKFEAVDQDINRDIAIKAVMGTEQERNWYAGIERVTVMSSYSDSASTESVLAYTLAADQLIIGAANRSMSQNGEYVVKIYSKNGGFVKVPVHLRAEAPELRIHPNFQAVVNQDILFELRNFNYAITNPIYEVVLDGKVLTGDCVDYHVVSNLVRLERGGVIKTPGKHSLTVKAKGFKEATIEFIVKENLNGYVPPVIEHNEEVKNAAPSLSGKASKQVKAAPQIDAISSATGGGSSSGGSGGSGGGGSIMRPAKLIFDFDMLSNAFILRSVGMETEASKRVIDIWESASKEAARMKGSDTFYEWGAYKDALRRAELESKALTFEAYIKQANAEKWVNRPYQVKYVLNNGLFGDLLSFGAIDNQAVPTVSTVAKTGEDIKISFPAGHKFLSQIEAVKKFGYTTLSSKDYRIEGDTLVVDKQHLANGKNEFNLVAKGYDVLNVSFLLEKEMVNIQLPKAYALGEDVFLNGFGGDFGKRLMGVSIDGKALLSKFAAGSSGHYEIKNDQLILFSKNFTHTAPMNIKLIADGYEPREVKLQLTGNVPPVLETGMQVPDSVFNTAIAKVEEPITISIGNEIRKEEKAYYEALNKGELKIDGQVTPFKLETVYGSYKLVVEAANNKIVGTRQLTLKVADYELKRIELTVKAKPETPKPVDPTPIPTPVPVPGTGGGTSTTSPAAVKVVPAISFDQVKVSNGFFGSKKEELLFNVAESTDDKYLKGLSFKVTLNGKSVGANLFTAKSANYNKPVTQLIVDKSYLQSILKTGENELIIEQNGYEINRVVFQL